MTTIAVADYYGTGRGQGGGGERWRLRTFVTKRDALVTPFALPSEHSDKLAPRQRQLPGAVAQEK